MRWGLIVLKGAVWPVMALVMGLLASRYLAAMSQVGSASGADLARWSTWAELAGLVAALVLYGAFVWRLWRWSEGAGPSCDRCTGPLGRIRDGKVYYGRQLSDFRRCYNCGNANPSPE